MHTRTAFLALAVAAAAAPAPEPGVRHIPFHSERLGPRADGSADLAAILTQLNTTLKKYKADHTLLPLSHYRDLFKGGILDGLLEGALDKRAVGKVPLTDQANDLLYYGDSKAGSQTFTTDFDTGSSDYFVPGPNCQGCHGTPYDESGVNRHTTTSVTYGSGMISGNDYFDTVTVGGLTAKNTNLISLTSAQGFSSSKSSSLMGMGFSTIANSKQPTFFENLMKQGKVDKPEFSFYLGRKKSGTAGASQLTLGGRDGSKFVGKATAHKVTQKGYWQLAIDGAAIDGSSALGLLEAGQAAIDTGTTVIIAPTVAATAIGVEFGAVPVPIAATGSATETAFAYMCGTKRKLSLVFDGKQYSINPKDYNLGEVAAGVCFLSIIAADLQPTENLYVVGDTFLKNWYSTYIYKPTAQVSFAKAKGADS